MGDLITDFCYKSVVKNLPILNIIAFLGGPVPVGSESVDKI